MKNNTINRTPTPESRAGSVVSMTNPPEETEQIQIFQWAAYSVGRFPELRLLHAIPNGGARSAVTGAKLKAQGVKAGVPDMCLPVSRGGYHGLYIELKRRHGGRVAPEQRTWIADLSGQGYLAVVCCGCDEAIDVLEKYLTGSLFAVTRYKRDYSKTNTTK